MRAATALSLPLLLALCVACSNARFRAPMPDGPADDGSDGTDKPEDSGEPAEAVDCEADVIDEVGDLDASLVEEGDVEAWCSDAETEAACTDARDNPTTFQAQTERGCSTWTASGREYACLPVWTDGKCCARVVFSAADHEGCDD